jgi:hypothetical protein
VQDLLKQVEVSEHGSLRKILDEQGQILDALREERTAFESHQRLLEE